MLSTADQDNGQTYTYSMLDGAGGRFKIQSNLLKVRLVAEQTLGLILKHLFLTASENVEFDWLLPCLRNKPDAQTQLCFHQTWRFDVQQGYAADMREHIVMKKPADQFVRHSSYHKGSLPRSRF